MRGGLFYQFAMRYTSYEVAYGGVGAGGMAMEDATGESEYDTEDDSLGDTEQEEEEEDREEDNIACQISIRILYKVDYRAVYSQYSPVLPLRIRPTGRTRMSRIHWIDHNSEAESRKKKERRIEI